MKTIHGVGFTSKMVMKGILTIHVKDAITGAVLRTIVKKNTITYDAGDIVRSLLAQRASDDPAVQLQLGSMRFGTSVTVPTRYDTNLLAEIPAVRKELTDVKKVNGITGELSLQATMEATEGNGNTYREAGLFTKGTTWNDPVGGTLEMFSRQIHAAIEKTSSVSLDYNWKLQFTV